ncbi:MAG TPA: lipid-binding SYLF domain-containing protein [Nitrospira sp.]|nr:lipid-binding SYLF domain-containing protein [Nitrospira sp.]
MIAFLEQKRLAAFTRTFMAGILIGILTAGAPVPAQASDFAEQQQVVEKAKMTLESFLTDPSVGPALRDLKSETKALFIVPQFLRGAFVFGGAGGHGVLIVRDEATKKWSEPAFYNIGSASFGLQVGGDVSEIIFVVRSQRGLEDFYRSEFKLGLDASMALGPVGEGGSLKGITADLVGYAKKKGIFAGMALDGSIITVSDDSNAAYYGKSVRPTDIIVKGSVSNPKSADLRNAAAKF